MSCTAMHCRGSPFLFLVRHGISELKTPCATALSKLEIHDEYKDTLRRERHIQQRITETLDQLVRDHHIKLTPIMEEAVRMIPRSIFVTPQKVDATFIVLHTDCKCF